jgi:hypothetical protein
MLIVVKRFKIFKSLIKEGQPSIFLRYDSGLILKENLSCPSIVRLQVSNPQKQKR